MTLVVALGILCLQSGTSFAYLAAQVTGCGNKQVEKGEKCDDGNARAGDGCSATCTVERGWSCKTNQSGVSVCASNCGNRSVDRGEKCDDGNVRDNDGCSASCTVEKNWRCTEINKLSRCVMKADVCGNGHVEGKEKCDDGNSSNSDGCSSTCTLEQGWYCSGTAPGLTTHCIRVYR